MQLPDLKNKTVAVVGNAQSIMNNTFGKEIDSHDFVIRMNRAMNLYDINDQYTPHVGERTDMWVVWRLSEYNELNIKEPDYVMQMAFWTGLPTDRPEDSILYFPLDMIVGLIEKTDIKVPSTGMMLLEWLDHQDTRKVSVYGFDWKKTPTWTDMDRVVDERMGHEFQREKDWCLKYPFIFNGLDNA